MKKVLVTGGTVFVSRCAAEHFIAQGCDVYVLNRNTHPQPAGATLIQADRHMPGDALRGHHFDVVIDTAYTAADVNTLLDFIDSCDDYILISSSAVYPEHCPQPFTEDCPTGENIHWGACGTNKIAAEQALLRRKPNAYILRPPYLYGPMNNVYREAFVFECAIAGRPFYLPGDGEMKLQFFHAADMCRFIDILLEKHPAQHIFNVGNREAVTAREWVDMCYRAAGTQPEFICVHDDIPQRSYFSFLDYEYHLDVTRQYALMPQTMSLEEGLKQAFSWYKDNADQVNKKPLIEYIDSHLRK